MVWVIGPLTIATVDVPYYFSHRKPKVFNRRIVKQERKKRERERITEVGNQIDSATQINGQIDSKVIRSVAMFNPNYYSANVRIIIYIMYLAHTTWATDYQAQVTAPA